MNALSEWNSFVCRGLTVHTHTHTHTHTHKVINWLAWLSRLASPNLQNRHPSLEAGRLLSYQEGLRQQNSLLPGGKVSLSSYSGLPWFGWGLSILERASCFAERADLNVNLIQKYFHRYRITSDQILGHRVALSSWPVRSTTTAWFGQEVETPRILSGWPLGFSFAGHRASALSSVGPIKRHILHWPPDLATDRAGTQGRRGRAYWFLLCPGGRVLACIWPVGGGVGHRAEPAGSSSADSGELLLAGPTASNSCPWLWPSPEPHPLTAQLAPANSGHANHLTHFCTLCLQPVCS